MAAKTILPPGFRFSPTDAELVCYYLKRKVMKKHFRFKAISDVELYKFSPWELPEKSQLRAKDLEWYFFCPRDRKYPNGPRTNRATDGGFWKATGRDRPVIQNSCTVGMKKTLIFHVGKPPKGNRTNWVMYEYRLESKELADAGFSQDAYALCKIFQKSGLGPKIGEQYGAPFSVEDCEDDTASECSFLLPSVLCLSPEPSNNQSTALNPVSQQPVSSHPTEVPADPDLDGISLDDIAAFLNISPLRENANDEVADSTNLGININENTEVNQEDIFNELETLCSQGMISCDVNPAEKIQSEVTMHSMHPELENDQYLELKDFYLLGESNLTESIVPSDPFAQNPPTHCSIFQNLNHVDDISPYLYYDGYGMYIPHDAGPDTASSPSTLNMQMGDFEGIAAHINYPVSEHVHLLQEHSPSLLGGPFR